MGTLHKVKGQWMVRFLLPRYLANKYGCKEFRRRYEKYAVAKDIHEIVQHAIANRDKDGELKRLLDQVEIGYTVKTFYDRWIKEYVTPRLEATTKTRYELSFKTINDGYGSVPLAEFDRAKLHAYIESRTGAVSASTINKDIIAIKKMFSYAFEVGAIPANPLVRFPALRVQEKARRIPEREEFEKLVNAMEDPALSAMVAVIGECGLRRSEAINLEWKNVNLRTGRITLERTKGKRVRSVPLSPYAVEMLRSLTRFVQQPRVFSHQTTGSAWISPDKAFRAGRKTVGLDWVTFHTLRHWFGTRMIRNGADIESVREIMGHLDIKTTDRYAKHAKAKAEDAIREAQAAEAVKQEEKKEKA